MDEGLFGGSVITPAHQDGFSSARFLLDEWATKPVRVINSVLDVVLSLKETVRTGWVEYNIPNPETVWQHSRSVRALVQTLAAKYLGPAAVEHCCKLAAVHDMTEAIVPDVTPFMGVTKRQKNGLEMLAIDHLCRTLPNGRRFFRLWTEYEEGRTEWSCFVKDADKLQVVVPTLEYELSDACVYNLEPFWMNAREKLKGSPLIAEWDALYAMRPPGASDKPVLLEETWPADTYERIRTLVMARLGRLEQG